jgi:hypothetical protein
MVAKENERLWKAVKRFGMTPHIIMKRREKNETHHININTLDDALDDQSALEFTVIVSRNPDNEVVYAQLHAVDCQRVRVVQSHARYRMCLPFATIEISELGLTLRDIYRNSYLFPFMLLAGQPRVFL